MDLTYLGLLPPHLGGIAHHGANVTRALAAAGHRVGRISWRHPYPARLYQGDLVDPLAFPVDGVRYSLDWYSPRSWWRAGRAAAAGEGIITPWVTPFHGPPTEVIARAAGDTPLVGIVHNALPHERHAFDELFARRALRTLNAAVAHGGQVADQARWLAPSLHIEVVPHPPNLDLHPHPLPTGPPFRLLAFGFVRAYKGMDLALDAMQQLRRRGLPVELTIAGRFWEPRERWEADVRARGLDGAVELVDRYFPDDEVDALFAAHHLVLAPYRSATQSGIVPLAFAAGRPIVATDVGGLGEVVHDGDNGRLVEVDAAAIATGIERTLDDLSHLADGSARSVTRWADVAEVLVDLVRRA